MKWGLQHVKVTLEDVETGEVVVIESDGAKPANDQGREKRSKSKDEKRSKSKDEARPKSKDDGKPKSKGEGKPKSKSQDEDRPKQKSKAKAKPESKPKDESKPKSKGEGKPKKPKAEKSSKQPLSWQFLKDENYDGYVAKIRIGAFKALRAHSTEWALFLEREGSPDPEHIACFDRLEQAKARAEQLYSSGWPESEYGEVTKEHLERACPRPESDREETPVRKTRTPKKEKRATPTPAPEPAPAPAPVADQAAKDAAMMRSFKEAAAAALDDDDDDD